MRRVMALGLALVLVGASAAAAADLYVRAGATGAGTKDAPYGFLWMALEKARRGDVLHVAAGTYNGKGGCGVFNATVPELTIVGGYSADFATRDPFKNHTILERATDYRGDELGLSDSIVGGKGDHGGLVLDGLVLNAVNRNDYKVTGDILPKNCVKGPCIGLVSANLKVRNCILINPYGEGIYNAWAGAENEVSNNFIVNCFYAGIDTRSAQDESLTRVVHNTVAFVWDEPGKGGGASLFVGRQGKVVAEKNAFIYTQGHAVTNCMGNDELALKDNVFLLCQGGYYKYTDAEKKNLLVWKPEELALMDKDPESFQLSACANNVERGLAIKPEKNYFERFTNYVASEPGVLHMDFMNELRSTLGLPLQAEPASPRKNFGMIYPLASVAAQLATTDGAVGVNLSGPFAVYASKTGASAAATAGTTGAATTYEDVTFAAFDPKVARDVPEGKLVSFMAGIGDSCYTFVLKQAAREDYDAVQLLKAGEAKPTRNYLFGYVLRGSEAQKQLKKLSAKADKLNAKGGVRFRGRAYYLGNESFVFPVAVIIDAVEKAE